MVYVPEGKFSMGSKEDDHEKPIHSVILSGYWIDQTEVTNSMFQNFVQSTNYQTEAEKAGFSGGYQGIHEWIDVTSADWKHPQGVSSNIDGMDDHPVVQVTWEDAKAYCEWAGRRLPTEAEWEKAARGIDGGLYPWGDIKYENDLANFADALNFPWSNRAINDGYKYTAPVGSYSKGASPYGALDMAGNVWEWVSDYWSKRYGAGDKNDPTGPGSGATRVLRGGSWSNTINDIRSTFRYPGWPDSTNYDIGFRCAVSESIFP